MDKDRFKERFRELYDLSDCISITQFAKELGMNRQSVDRYYNGERCPDAPAFAQICEKMNVSADWLLGLSDVYTPSADLRAVTEFTGLSEKTIKWIVALPDEKKKALNQFICHNGFNRLINTYSEFLKLLEEAKKQVKHDVPGLDIGIGYEADITVQENGTVSISTIWKSLFLLEQELGWHAVEIADGDKLTVYEGNDEKDETAT